MKPKIRITPKGIMPTEAAVRRQAEAEAEAILREAARKQQQRNSEATAAR